MSPQCWRRSLCCRQESSIEAKFSKMEGRWGEKCSCFVVEITRSLPKTPKPVQLSHCSANSTVFTIETAGVMEVDVWSSGST